MSDYDNITNLPTEKHQAPADIPKANAVTTPLGAYVEVDGTKIVEAKIKFVGGLSPREIAAPPELGETRAYIVLAQCTKHHVDRVNDEPRLTVDMQPYTIYDRTLGAFGDQIERQPGDPLPDESAEGGLFDDAGEITGDLDGEGGDR